ncbi:MAG: hypothetical protein HOD92_04830 [Deltaproteobacteria bacterium]|nr:hypothetical protein [Deltaproteobacteria bacterium]MBT4525115.1 hypothetical protein [Deltaproteobacteria bacterium]
MLNLLNRYLELSKREKILMVITICVLLPMLLYRLIIVTIQDYQEDLSKHNTKLEQNIKSVNLLGQELRYYERLSQRKVQSLSKRMNHILNRTKLKIKSRISVGDRPRTGQKLVLTLTDLNLNELVNLIYRIEHSSPVILIDSFDLSPTYKSDKLFKINMSLSSE